VRACIGLIAVAIAGIAGSLHSPVRAEETVAYASRSGLRFLLPVGMYPVPVPQGMAAAKRSVEQVLQDDAAARLRLFVVSAPPPGAPSLPPDTEAVRNAYAKRIVDDAWPLLKHAELVSTPRAEYDPARGMLSVQLMARDRSYARALLEDVGGDAMRREADKAGISRSDLRCALIELLDGALFIDAEQAQRGVRAAAERCIVPVERVAVAVRGLGPVAFGPSPIVLRAVMFLTRPATVTFYALAPVSRERDAVALTDLIAGSARVEADDRLPSWTPNSLRLIGIALASMLSILTLGGVLAWALVRGLRVSAGSGVAAAFVCLNVLAFSGYVSGADVAAPAWVQWLGYLLCSVVLYRPMTKWLASHGLGHYPHTRLK